MPHHLPLPSSPSRIPDYDDVMPPDTYSVQAPSGGVTMMMSTSRMMFTTILKILYSQR
ncbi:hypothetical protein Tco_1112436, partial [Tanacetum coccineum]